MRIQRGTVYMAPHIAEIMGAIPNRMWWKPWRWQVEFLPWDMRELQQVTFLGWTVTTQNSYLVRNLTRDGAIGVMKLYGIKHKDFGEDDGNNTTSA